MALRKAFYAVLAIAPVAIALACSSKTPTTPDPAPSAAVTEMQIHTRVAVLRVGDTEQAEASARYSDGTARAVTSAITWMSSDESVLSVSPTGNMRGVGAGIARVRATVQGVVGEVAQPVASLGPVPAPGPSAAAASIVIEQFRTSGAAGANDEFIQIRNTSGANVDLSGWGLVFSDSGGMRSSLGQLAGVTVAPGCRYLFTNVGPNGYSSSSVALGDFRYLLPFIDDGGLAVVDNRGAIVDQVGMSGGSAYGEGTRLTPVAGRSYQRTMDSGNNQVDFALAVDAGRPMSSTSSCQ